MQGRAQRSSTITTAAENVPSPAAIECGHSGHPDAQRDFWHRDCIGWQACLCARMAMSNGNDSMSIEDRSFTMKGGRTGFILLHGLGGTPIEMQSYAKGLNREGYTVHCPQIAGHGGSHDTLAATYWQSWYGTVTDAHERLKRDCDTIIVGGLSMGAVLALHHAAQNPREVHGVVALAPLLKLDGWGVPWHARFFKLVRQRWTASLFKFPETGSYGIKDDRMREFVAKTVATGGAAEAARLSKPGISMYELQELSRIVAKQIGTIRQPILLVHPREDDRASFRSNAVFVQERAGGYVETVVLDDCYHCVTVDRQRDLVTTKTIAFANWLDSHRALEEFRAAPATRSRPAGSAA
jgi:carboxylesterase